MLARQISLLPPLPITLTPLLRYPCELFAAPKKVNSFVIKQIHTLFGRSPGVGCPTLRRLCALRGSALSFSLLASPLFSWSYELLFQQTLSFHKHLRCPMFFSSAVLFVTRFRRIFEAWSLATPTRHSPLATRHWKTKRPGGLLRGAYQYEPAY
jgi:hypothetical protein